MAPPRKHQTDAILDAARELVLDDGPRAASVAAIAKASGAPAGTLYHRFRNRDGILTAAWLRALERFQTRAMAANSETALDTAVAMAVAGIGFARELPDDARLLLTIRPGDLLDGRPTERTELEMVRKRPLPFPPEPLASIGIQATRWSLDRADHSAGRRNLLLRTLDALGLGFDS